MKWWYELVTSVSNFRCENAMSVSLLEEERKVNRMCLYKQKPIYLTSRALSYSSIMSDPERGI